MIEDEGDSASFSTDGRVQLVKHGMHARVYVTGVFCEPSQCSGGRRGDRLFSRLLVDHRKVEVGDGIQITLLAYIDRFEDGGEWPKRDQLQWVVRVELVSQRESRQRRTEAGVLGSDLGHGDWWF